MTALIIHLIKIGEMIFFNQYPYKRIIIYDYRELSQSIQIKKEPTIAINGLPLYNNIKIDNALHPPICTTVNQEKYEIFL